MAWPIDPKRLQSLEQLCVGFATGGSFNSLPDICASGALLSNAQLPKGTLKPSQEHDSKSKPLGYDSVYFRFVRRQTKDDLVRYKCNILDSLVSVGSHGGLIFYVDFETAYRHLTYNFANSTDVIGRVGTLEANDQIDTVVAALRKKVKLAEITFKKEVPLSCVTYIGVNFGPVSRETPTYMSTDLFDRWQKIVNPQAWQESARKSRCDYGRKKPKMQEWVTLISRLFEVYKKRAKPQVAFSLLEQNCYIRDSNKNLWCLFKNDCYKDIVPPRIADFPSPPVQPSSSSKPAQKSISCASNHAGKSQKAKIFKPKLTKK